MALSRLGGVADLFKVSGDSRDSRNRRFCEQRLSEGLVVDILARYNPSEKTVVLCKDLIEEFVRIYKVDEVGCYETFLLYVLLHEHAHYLTDVLGLLERLSGLSEPARFDEPFCEYVALKSIATGVYSVLGFEKRIETPVNARTCAPFIAKFHRPYPYSLFRELYAIPSEVFGIKAEDVLLSLIRKASRLKRTLKSQVKSPEPESLLRLALFAMLGKAESESVRALGEITPARVVVA